MTLDLDLLSLAIGAVAAVLLVAFTLLIVLANRGDL